MTAYKTLGLTLGGGGTKGFAHLGFYKVLYENKIPIHSLAGCSIGALIAAGIAQGKSPDEMLKTLTHFVEEEHSFFRMNNWGLGKGSLLTATKEMKMLEEIIPPDLNFEELKLPLAINAVDLEKGDLIVFKTGNVLKAVEASMSIPGLFPPIFYEGRLLVDGGVLNSIPVDICRELGADVQVAVDLKSFYTEQNISGLIYHFYLQKDIEKIDKLQLPRKMIQEAMLKMSFPLTVLLRSVCIAEEAYRKRILEEFKPDLLVHPDVSEYSFLDIESYMEVYAKGLDAGESALPKIQDLLTHIK